MDDTRVVEPDTRATPASPGSPDDAAALTATLPELEAQLTDQVELVAVMSDIAEVDRRTYALEQQRDLESTRGVFFGFVVSVAVIAAGWAPVVTMDWSQRGLLLALTLVTCAVAGLVYVAITRWQTRKTD